MSPIPFGPLPYPGGDRITMISELRSDGSRSDCRTGKGRCGTQLEMECERTLWGTRAADGRCTALDGAGMAAGTSR